jgi:hypothetical protein
MPRNSFDFFPIFKELFDYFIPGFAEGGDTAGYVRGSVSERFLI